MGALRKRGLSARSVARAVHAARGFFRFAVREGRLAVDPMENLRAPRPFKALPRFLTRAQVEALLRRPRPQGALRAAGPGHPRDDVRDRPARLRAHGPAPDRLDLEVGLLRCMGQGAEGAAGPHGPRGLPAACEQYLTDARPELSRRDRGSPYLFLNHRGPAPLAHGAVAHRATPRPHRGGGPRAHPARAAPLVRQPSPGAGRRPARACRRCSATPTSRPPRSTPT